MENGFEDHRESTSNVSTGEDEAELFDELEKLSDSAKLIVYRNLYQQECRAWLLWCIVSLLLFFCLRVALVNLSIWLAVPTILAVVCYGCFIAFWVISPSQKLLGNLRERVGREKCRLIEDSFDDSWNAVRDFVPPLLIPPVIVFGLLLFQLLKL